MNNPSPDPSSYPTAETRVSTAAEEALAVWFAEQQTKSVDNLEQAARQLITLCSSLLTVLLGITALSAQRPPPYLQSAFFQLCSLVTVLALLATLAAAIVVTMPGANPVISNDPDDMRNVFAELLRYKNRALRAALFAFALGMITLTCMIITALVIVFWSL